MRAAIPFIDAVRRSGTCGQLIAARDWTDTVLGPLENWPASLRSTLLLLLRSAAPVALLWGKDGMLLYNDGYAAIVGRRHPEVLGCNVREGWPEFADLNDEVMRIVLDGGTVSHRDRDLTLDRNGHPEQLVFDLEYSPVPGNDGKPAGVLAIVIENTERVVAERAAAAERERQRLMLQQMPGFAALLEGPEHRFAYVNDAYVEISGNRQFVGRTVREVFPDIAGQGFYELLDRAYATGEPFTARAMPISLDQEDGERFIDLLYEPVRGDDGRVTGIFVGGYDVTEQVRAERVLAESEARYRALFENMDAGFCVVELKFDPDGSPIDYRLAEINPAFEEQTGLRGAAGRWVSEAVPGLERHWFETYGRVALTGEPARFENYAAPFGRWYDVHAFRTGEPDERRVAILFNDVTARKTVEARLRESEERFRNMADQSPLMMWVTDPDGRCTYLNRRWYEFTGQTPGEAEGFGWLEATHPDDKAEAGRIFVEANAAAAPFRLEYRLRRADGSYRWAIDAASPRYAEDGRYLGYVGSVIDIDERREAEAALRASEARLMALARASSDVLYRMRPDWGEMKELDGGGFLADTSDPNRAWLMAYIPEDERARVTVAIDEAIRNRSVFDLEHRVMRADGSVGWTRSRAVPVLGASGEIVEWFGAASDITERRQAEEALRGLNATLEQRVSDALAERKLLLDLIENADTLLIAADLDYHVLAINKAGSDSFEQVYGVRPQVGDSMLDLLANRPDEQAAVRAHWGRALAGEEFTQVAEFGDPDHERRSFNVRFSILRDAQGERIGAYQFVQDVTEQLRERERLAAAEAARREADALYRAYFKNTAEALFVVQVLDDGGFALEELNPAHEATTGLRTQAVGGRRLDEFLSPEDTRAVSERYRRCVETGEVQAYRETLDLPAGTFHWDTVLVPVRDDAGRVVRLVGSARDMTAQVHAEESLRQSQKLETIGQLTGGVAHDFNNLLTPIVATLDMLQRKGLGGEREQRLIGGAAQSAERARVLVQRLLAFARRQPLQAVPVDMGKLVAGMGELVASTTGPQIKVVVEAPDGLPPARADANQVEMALLNLAVNARDAMPNGGTLRMSVGIDTVGRKPPSQLAPGSYIRLSVADTGVGMDEETARRAIEPFFSTKGIGKGTGLGLSMAHGLALQLGGALTIQSRPGLGTNIELWLPLADAAPVEQAPADAPVISRRGTALLVDDDELVRASTADMLVELGYAVVEAESAEEALRLIHAGEPFDLLVTDHLMPGMNGSDLATAIRSATPSMPVLLVSGYAEDAGVAPDLPRVTKPFRRDELAASIAKLIPAP